MMKLVMDGALRGADGVWTCWSDVIDAIDREVAPYGRIVTSVRIDGDEHAAFRSPELLGRVVEAMGVVEVRTGTKADLVGGCVTDAAEAIEALRGAAANVGAAFRRHDLQPANVGLQQLAGGISTLIALLQAVAVALDVDLNARRGDEPAPADLVAELGGYIESLIAAQSNQDWLTVADVVEYDVEPALKRWHALFASFTQAAAPEPLRIAV